MAEEPGISERFRGLVEQSLDGIVLTDAKGIVVEWNRAMEHIIGLKTEEVLGQPIWDVQFRLGFEEEKTQAWYQQLKGMILEALASGQALWLGEPSQREYLHPDGTRRCIQSMTFPIQTEEGFMLGSISRDVTGAVQAQEALRRSERALRIRDQFNSIFLSYADEEMYAEILKLILATMSSEYGTFGYFDEDGSFVAPALTRQIYWEKCDVPQKEIIFQKGTFGGIWGRAIEERKTLISNDGPFRVPEGHISIRNTMVTPIIFRDQVISAIHVANKPGGYDEEDRAMVEMIAAEIAPVLYARVQRDRREEERRRAVESLRQSEERYRLLLESTSDSVYVLDPQWRHVVVNEAAARFVQTPKEMLLESKLTDLFPGIEETVFFQTFRQVMGTREPGIVTAEYVFRDGRRGWYEVHVDPVPEGILCISRDITERKQSEEALRRERDLVARVMDTSPVGITVFDQQGRITFANALVHQTAALSAESTPVGRAYNDPVWQMMTEDGRPCPGEELPFARVMATGQPIHDARYAIELPDGQRLFISSNAAPLFDESGQIDGVIVTTEDITAQVQADQELRQSEEKYRDLVESISDVLYTLDGEGVITYVSPAIESCMGYSPEEVIGQTFARFILPEDLERIQGSFQRLASGASLGPNEYRVATASGEIRWMRVSSQTVVDGGQVTGVTGVLTDITARKQAEEQLEAAAAAAERERLARDLHDAVTQTLFSVAAIAEALPRIWERNPEEAWRGLEELRRLAQGALAEMRTMLLELRPSALTEHNLGALLQQLTEAMMGRTRIPLTTVVVGDCSLPAEVRVALYRIAQEALNNIAKHARASEAEINLHCQPGRVRLCISDNGRGFDPNGVEAHQLGLRIMRERAQAVGAMLKIERGEGHGTRVVVDWPGGQERQDDG